MKGRTDDESRNWLQSFGFDRFGLFVCVAVATSVRHGKVAIIRRPMFAPLGQPASRHQGGMLRAEKLAFVSFGRAQKVCAPAESRPTARSFARLIGHKSRLINPRPGANRARFQERRARPQPQRRGAAEASARSDSTRAPLAVIFGPRERRRNIWRANLCCLLHKFAA